MDLEEIGWECVDCVHRPQNRDQFPALINTIMHLWVPQKVGISWLSE